MKTILITGSTDGIGKLAAIKLAQDGHTLYLHGRNEEKLKYVISEIKTLSGNDNISGFVTDLSDLNATKKMANTVAAELPKLDVLINNAGVFTSSVDKTDAGFDIRFAVNYFAPYILTNTLLPLLQKSETPRIVNLSSAAQAPVFLDALVGHASISVQAAYAQSKLALTMWSFYLAKAEPNITCIAVNPGSLLNTNMVKVAYGQHWSSADKGANVLYQLAVTDRFANNSGKYFDNDLSSKDGIELGNFNSAHPDAYDEHKVAELIKTTEELMPLV